MLPTLIEVFGEPLPAYFTMLMVGFGLAIYIAARWSKRAGFDHDTTIDLGLFMLIFGVAGARVLHVIADGYFWDYVHLCTDPSLVAWQVTESQCTQIEGLWDTAASVCRPVERDCFAWAAFWRGGLAYYGGLLAAGSFGIYFVRREGFPVGKALDMVGMVIPIGLFFGRMGCFLGGCCFGKPLEHDHLFAVTFPEWSAASESQWKEGLLAEPWLASLPVHPTQLYEAIGSLLIAGICMFVIMPRKRFDGQVMLMFLALYAVLRFVLEYFRADDRGALLGLSTSQLIGFAILLGVGYAWQKLAKAGAAPTPTVEPAESKPAESKPAESKPAESKPAESKPDGET